MKALMRWVAALVMTALVLANLPGSVQLASAAVTCTISATPDGRPLINPTAQGPGSGKKIGFDNTHGETAGQADWVIDGGFSDMGCALAGQGYTVEEIRTYPLTTATLNSYDVVVFPEPNIPFTTAEMAAVEQYVASGKGLLLVGDHYQADRNLNTWDAAEVFNGFRRGHYGETFTSPTYNYNGFTTTSTYTFNPGADWLANAFGFRFRYNALDLATGGQNFRPGNQADPEDPGILAPDKTYGVTAGVSSVATYAGATLSIVDPSKALGVVYPNKNSVRRWNNAEANDPVAVYTDNVGAPAGGTATFGGINEGAYVVIAKPNAGKVAAAGDSSLWEDGSPKYRREADGSTKSTHDGWLDSDHDTLGINVINWLATPDTATTSIDPALRQLVTPEPVDPFTIGEPINEPWSNPAAGYLWYDACTFKSGAYIGSTQCGTTPPPPTSGWNVTYVPANVYPGNRVATYLDATGLTPGAPQSTAFYWYVNGAGTQVSYRYNRTTGTFEPGLTAQTLTVDSQGKIQRWEFWNIDQASANRPLNLRLKLASTTKYTSPIINQVATGSFGYLKVEQSLGYSDGLHAALFTKDGSLDTAVGLLPGADTTITLPSGTYSLEIRNDTTAKKTGVSVTIAAGQTVSLSDLTTPPPPSAAWSWQNVPGNAYPGNKLAVVLDAQGLTPGATYSNQAYVYLTGGAQVSKRYNRTTDQFVDGLTAQELTASVQGKIQRYEFWELTQTANTTADYNVRVKVAGSTKDTKTIKQVATGNFGYLKVEQSLGFSDGLHAALFTAGGVLDTAVGLNKAADTTITLPPGTYSLDIRTDGEVKKSGVAVTITAGQTTSLTQILTPPAATTWSFDYVSANIYPGNKLAAYTNVQHLAPESAQTFAAYVYLTGGTQVSKRYDRATGQFVDGLTAQTLTADASGSIQRWEIWEIAANSNKTPDYNLRIKQGSSNKVTKVIKQVATGNFGYLLIPQSFGYADGLHVALFSKNGALDTAVGLNGGADTTVTLPEGTYTLEVRSDAGAALSDVAFTVTAGQTISLTAILDSTPPVISGASAPAPNAEGWNNSDVTVAFTCADAESGIFTCTEPVVLSAEGAGQSASGTATDLAGNTATAEVTGINIDKTAPVVTVAGDRVYTVDETVTITCTAADSLSGLAADPCGAPLLSVPAYTLTPGQHELTVTATDRAGNATAVTVSYSVSVTLQSLRVMTGRLVDHKGIQNSLLAKLEQDNKPNPAAYRHELSAQKGKQVSTEAAEILDALAAALMK